MLEAIIRRLKRDKRGVSNVIVVMLSLVLIVIIVGNVVLWSYQMNQLDFEKTQETLNVTNVTRITRSPWFTAQNEFTINTGSRLSGTCTDTRTIDSLSETFREEGEIRAFNPSGYVLNSFTKYVSGGVSNLNSNNDVYMNFRSYPNYEVQYQESLASSSTTNTAYQDKVIISFKPQITASFIIITTAEVQGSSTSYQAKARITVNATTYQELLYRVKDVTDWYPFCGVKRLTLNEDTTYVFKIQYCTNNAGGTAYIRNARLILLSLQSEYTESEALSTTSSTAWQDKAVLTFTPQSSGDYLIVASANYQGSSTSYDVKIRLIQDNTTVHTDTLGRPGSGTTANYYTFGVMRQVTLDSASHNFTMQYCSSSASGIAGMNHAHIIAIRVNQFDADYYVESENESSPPASDVWYDKVTNTYTVDAGDYLLMGSASYKSGSTFNSIGLDFQTDSASRYSPLVEHRDANTYESAFFMTKQTLTVGSKTDRIRWMGESTSARIRNARLTSCKLPTLMQTVEVEFAGASNVQNWTQLDWTIDSSFTTADVATTFQLYNYQTGQYPISGDGYMISIIGTADVTENLTNTSNPTNFREVNGTWKIKIQGVKATDTQFELKVDWVEFKVTSYDIYRLNISNNFTLDLSIYPLNYLRGIEILIRYNITENAERWFLKAYNWSESNFSDVGFNNTSGNQPIINEWNEYAINITADWASYVESDGAVLIEFSDEGLNATQAVVEIDFIGVRAITNGASFELRNSGPLTTHVIAIWIVNSTNHHRYETNFYMNSGEETTYIRTDISLPGGEFIVKVATERGNIAVFLGE